METLECVGTKKLVNFFSNEEIVFNKSMDRRIIIKNRIFDFSKIDEFRKQKTVTLKAQTLRFENCIITGSLLFRDCTFVCFEFKYCTFKKPEFIGKTPDQFESLYFLNVTAVSLCIENCLFDCPIVISDGSIDAVRFNTITCPRLWLQNMNSGETVLSIRRFLERKIYVPFEKQFKQLHADDTLLRQIEGRKDNVTVHFPDLT